MAEKTGQKNFRFRKKKHIFFKKINKNRIFRLKIDIQRVGPKIPIRSYFLVTFGSIKLPKKRRKKNFWGIFEKKNASKKKTHTYMYFFFRQIIRWRIFSDQDLFIFLSM